MFFSDYHRKKKERERKKLRSTRDRGVSSHQRPPYPPRCALWTPASTPPMSNNFCYVTRRNIAQHSTAKIIVHQGPLRRGTRAPQGDMAYPIERSLGLAPPPPSAKPRLTPRSSTFVASRRSVARRSARGARVGCAAAPPSHARLGRRASRAARLSCEGGRQTISRVGGAVCGRLTPQAISNCARTRVFARAQIFSARAKNPL